MTLTSLKNGKSALITNLNLDSKSIERFFNLGIAKSKIVKKINTTLGGSTILIELDKSCVILRKSEANSIEVEEILSE